MVGMNDGALCQIVLLQPFHVLFFQVQERAADAMRQFYRDIATPHFVKKLIADLHLVGNPLRCPSTAGRTRKRADERREEARIAE